jgi:hypothetical protein
MRREPGFNQSSDNDNDQNTNELPPSAVGEIGEKSFEITDIFKKSLRSRLNGHDAIKRAAEKECTESGMNDKKQPTNKVHLATHTWWIEFCRE